MKRKFFYPWASCLIIAGAVVAGCGTDNGNTGAGGTGANSASGGNNSGGAGGTGGGIGPMGCNPACVAPQVCSASSTCIDPGTCASDVDCLGGTVCDTATSTCVPGGACGAQEAKVEPVPPNMLLVLDRSCSMKDAVGNVTKWDIAVAAINKMTTDFAGQIRFGLTLFPDKIAPDCQQDEIPIPVAPGNEMAIQTMMTAALVNTDPLFPNGPCVTNILTGIQQAAMKEPAFLDTERASFALLMTDGKATCGSDATTEQVIQTMFQMAGVPTFVIGFGSGVDPAQMDKFAVAGGVPSSGTHKYYDASDQASLDVALSTIAKSTLSCTYALDSVPPNPSEIFVFFDNVNKVPRDLTDGWEYDVTKNQIVFYGPACDSLKNGIVKDLDIVFGCDAPTPN